MEKPILLLDVDGVLNVFGPYAERMEREYEKRLVQLPERCYQFYPTPIVKPFLRWAWRHFDVLWMTAWMESANQIAVWAGLPPVKAFTDRKLSPGVGDWKLARAMELRQATLQPIAWIEDGIGPEAEAWVSSINGLLPTKYFATKHDYGVTRDIADEIAGWAGIPLMGESGG